MKLSQRPAAWLAILALVCLGGCPAAALTGGDSVAGSSSAAGARNVESISDTLTEQFPDCSEPLTAEQWKGDILRLVNEARAAEGLGTVVHSDTLEDQAAQYACEMVQFDFFDHVNPVTGSTLRVRAEQFGYDFQVIGENLAAGQRTPQETFDAWMASPGHRDNILDPRFTELGVGVRSGGSYLLYWVQEFGLPMEELSAFNGPRAGLRP